MSSGGQIAIIQHQQMAITAVWTQHIEQQLIDIRFIEIGVIIPVHPAAVRIAVGSTLRMISGFAIGPICRLNHCGEAIQWK